MAGTADQVLDIARTQIGYDGDGSSDYPVTKFGEWFGVQTQWCAMFASWCLYNCQVDPFGRWPKGEDYCPAWVESWRNHGLWVADPMPGDLVFYSWNLDGVADHVGLVEAVNPNGTIQTIEGNTDDPNLEGYEWGNCCRRKVRYPIPNVMGYGRPLYAIEYADTSTSQLLVEDAMFELVKADGNPSVYSISTAGCKGFTGVRKAMVLSTSILNLRKITDPGKWPTSVRHVTSEELTYLLEQFGKA